MRIGQAIFPLCSVHGKAVGAEDTEVNSGFAGWIRAITMARSNEDIRHYVLLKADADPLLPSKYFDNEKSSERDTNSWIESYIAQPVVGVSKEDPPYRVLALPSREVTSSITGKAPRTGTLVVSLSVKGKSAVDRLMAAAASTDAKSVFLGSSPDLPFSATDHWCPAEAVDPIFANRAAAERLSGIPFLRSQNGKTRKGKRIVTSGRGVNVVIVDQGLNKTHLGTRYGGGWAVGTTQPGTATPPLGTVHRSHGMMIAQNIQKVAPEVTFFDLPLLPEKISDIPVFLSFAQAAFKTMLSDIASYRSGGGAYSGPWILVNPWGIFDTRS